MLELTSRAELGPALSSAPDLLVLGADASSRIGELLAASRASGSAVPIAMLVGGEGAERDVLGRFGLVARWPAGLAAMPIADAVDDLLRDLSAHTAAALRAPPGARARAEWLETLADRGKAGVLVRADGAAGVLTAEGRCVPSDLMESAAEVALLEAPFARARTTSGSSTPGSLEGARVLVVDSSDSGPWCSALGDAGASVQPLERASASSIDAALSFVPSVVVVSTASLRDGLPPRWHDERLSEAALVVVTEGSAERVVAAAAHAFDAERRVHEALAGGGHVVGRVESLGPPRWLKALARAEAELTVRVVCAQGLIELELAGGRVRSALRHANPEHDEVAIRGRHALALMLATRFGRVVAGPRAVVEAHRFHLIDHEATHARGRIEEPRRPREVAPVGESGQCPIVPRPVRGASATVGALRASPPQVPVRRPVAMAVAHLERPPPARAHPASRTVTASHDTAPAPPAPSASAAKRPPPPPRAALSSHAKSRAPAAVARAPVSEAAAAHAGRAEASGPHHAAAATGARATSSQPAAHPLGAATQRLARERERRAARGHHPSAPALASTCAGGAFAPRGTSATPPTISSAEPEARTHLPSARRAMWLGSAAAVLVMISLAAWASFASTEPAPAPERPSFDGESDPLPTTGDLPASTSPREAEAHEPNRIPAVVSPSMDVERLGAPDVAAILARARQAHRERDWPRAEMLAREALSHAPGHVDGRYRLALSLFRQQRDSEALTELELALSTSPATGASRLLLGDIHARNARRRQAEREWQTCSEEHPDFEPCRSRLARMHRSGLRLPTSIRRNPR